MMMMCVCVTMLTNLSFIFYLFAYKASWRSPHEGFLKEPMIPIVRNQMPTSKILSPVLWCQKGAELCVKGEIESPSTSLMLYIVTWTLKQYVYIQSPTESIIHLSRPKTPGMVPSSYLQPFQSSATNFIWRRWIHTKYVHKSKKLFLCW